MLADPELESFISKPAVTCWLGPGRHIVGYCIVSRSALFQPGHPFLIVSQSGKELYNIVLAFSEEDSVESWTLEGSALKMRTEFSSWEPRCVIIYSTQSHLIYNCRVQKILKLVQATYKWKLMDRPPLETWIHPSGRLLLVGDACHPMLVSCKGLPVRRHLILCISISPIGHKVRQWL